MFLYIDQMTKITTDRVLASHAYLLVCNITKFKLTTRYSMQVIHQIPNEITKMRKHINT